MSHLVGGKIWVEGQESGPTSRRKLRIGQPNDSGQNQPSAVSDHFNPIKEEFAIKPEEQANRLVVTTMPQQPKGVDNKDQSNTLNQITKLKVKLTSHGLIDNIGKHLPDDLHDKNRWTI